jgi:hypothetical protein
MTGEKVQKVIGEYVQVLCDDYRISALEAERNADAPTLNGRLKHLLWMCGQISLFLQQGKIDKAFRWLGFLQGAFWAYGIRSVEQSKHDNKPEGEAFDKGHV